jgi:hypothetical protein
VSFDGLVTGAVIDYRYLWVREAAKGETEGRKRRRVAVGIRLSRPGGDVLILFPITSKSPPPERFAVEIPETEKRRAGLSVDSALWIVLDEYNEDVVGRSFYIEPDCIRGRFSKAFFLPVLKRFVAERAKAAGVDRR